MRLDFFETIRKRRSIRRFSDEPVAHEDIMTILEAATLAPSATNEQPWHFIIIRDSDLKQRMRDVVNALVETIMATSDNQSRQKRLSGMQFYSTHFADAPVAIAVLARSWVGGGYSSPTDAAPHDLALESVSMAAAYIQLAATALGYSSCFASAPAEFAQQELEAMLGVDPPWFLLGIISLGVAENLLQTEPQRPRRKSLEDICTFID